MLINVVNGPCFAAEVLDILVGRFGLVTLAPLRARIAGVTDGLVRGDGPVAGRGTA